MRALSAAMPVRRWPEPWKTAFSTARTAIASTRRARRRAPNARHSCGGSSASILSLNTALSCACCIPHSRNCGAALEPKLRGGFLRRMPEKTAESNSRRALPPRAPPLLCGCFLVRNTPRGRSFVRRMPEKTARSNSRWALPPRAPRCFLVACMEWEARQKKRPPRSLNSGAGAAYFIRRETAAGTRAGCSSLPRTAKRHRRERACPCRSR